MIQALEPEYDRGAALDETKGCLYRSLSSSFQHVGFAAEQLRRGRCHAARHFAYQAESHYLAAVQMLFTTEDLTIWQREALQSQLGVLVDLLFLLNRYVRDVDAAPAVPAEVSALQILAVGRKILDAMEA